MAKPPAWGTCSSTRTPSLKPTNGPRGLGGEATTPTEARAPVRGDGVLARAATASLREAPETPPTPRAPRRTTARSSPRTCGTRFAPRRIASRKPRRPPWRPSLATSQPPPRPCAATWATSRICRASPRTSDPSCSWETPRASTPREAREGSACRWRCEIAARFGMPRAAEYAARLRHNGKNMTRLDDIAWLARAINCNLNSPRPVRGRDAGRHARGRFDRHSKIRTIGRVVFIDHERQF